MNYSQPIQISAIIGLCALLSACATAGPHVEARVNSSMVQTSSLGSELVPMSDEEAQTASSSKKSSRKIATSQSSSRHGKLEEESSSEETTINSTSTERVIQTIPLSAPNTEVLVE